MFIEQISVIQAIRMAPHLQNAADRLTATISKFSLEGKIGLCGIALIVMMAIFAPLLSAYPPGKITGGSLELPGSDHPLGTDELGMDIWSQICYGARMSLFIGLAVACIAGLGGGALGILAGYLGGVADQLVMRTVDVIMALPAFPLLIVISAFMGPNIFNVIFVLVLFSGQSRRVLPAHRLSLSRATPTSPLQKTMGRHRSTWYDAISFRKCSPSSSSLSSA